MAPHPPTQGRLPSLLPRMDPSHRDDTRSRSLEPRGLTGLGSGQRTAPMYSGSVTKPATGVGGQPARGRRAEVRRVEVGRHSPPRDRNPSLCVGPTCLPAGNVTIGLPHGGVSTPQPPRVRCTAPLGSYTTSHRHIEPVVQPRGSRFLSALCAQPSHRAQWRAASDNHRPHRPRLRTPDYDLGCGSAAPHRHQYVRSCRTGRPTPSDHLCLWETMYRLLTLTRQVTAFHAGAGIRAAAAQSASAAPPRLPGFVPRAALGGEHHPTTGGGALPPRFCCDTSFQVHSGDPDQPRRHHQLPCCSACRRPLPCRAQPRPPPGRSPRCRRSAWRTRWWTWMAMR